MWLKIAGIYDLLLIASVRLQLGTSKEKLKWSEVNSQELISLLDKKPSGRHMLAQVWVTSKCHEGSKAQRQLQLHYYHIQVQGQKEEIDRKIRGFYLKRFVLLFRKEASPPSTHILFHPLHSYSCDPQYLPHQVSLIAPSICECMLPGQ